MCDAEVAHSSEARCRSVEEDQKGCRHPESPGAAAGLSRREHRRPAMSALPSEMAMLAGDGVGFVLLFFGSLMAWSYHVSGFVSWGNCELREDDFFS